MLVLKMLEEERLEKRALWERNRELEKTNSEQ